MSRKAPRASAPVAPAQDPAPLRTTFTPEEHTAFGELFALVNLIELAAHGARKAGETYAARQLDMLGATVLERVAQIIRTGEPRVSTDKDVRAFIKAWRVEERATFRATFNPTPPATVRKKR